jgi:hypothetical protein
MEFTTNQFDIAAGAVCVLGAACAAGNPAAVAACAAGNPAAATPVDGAPR